MKKENYFSAFWSSLIPFIKMSFTRKSSNTFKRRGKFMSYFRNIAVNQNSIFAELGFSNVSKLSEYIKWSIEKNNI